MKHTALAAALLLAAPAWAEKPLGFEQFENRVTGQTFTWARPGQAAYGIETYGANREVLWTIIGADCTQGYYYPGPDTQVCFVYPSDGVEQCWRFYDDAGTLLGRSLAQSAVILAPSEFTASCIQDFLGS